MDTLIQRLVANPHDEEALAYAHRAGTQDPRSYATLLEKVGVATQDPGYAAHWLSEAANVWSTTIGDAHYAARMLMAALEKDPTHRGATDRLAQLYREKGDQKALAAMLERLVKALTPMIYEKPEVRDQLIAMHEELGRIWGEPPLSRPDRAFENWRRLAELDPRNAYAIYAAREHLKATQQYADALPFFAMEQALVDDPARKVALFRDEMDLRRRIGDLAGATQALRGLRGLDPNDVGITLELGSLVVERVDAGEMVPAAERDEAATLLVALAEAYGGEYGITYAVAALRAVPSHDRAMQLADYYATQLHRTAELGPQYAAYLQASPNGFFAGEARKKVGAAQPPPPPPPRPPQAPQPSRPAQPVESGSQGGRASWGGGAPQPPSSQMGGMPQMGQAPQMGGMPQMGQAPQMGGMPQMGQAPQMGGMPQMGMAPAHTPSSPGAPAAPAVGDLQAMLEEAHQEAAKGRKPQALAKYRDVLKIEPANSEALSWVEEHLRQKRMYADLRDVLLAASRAPGVSNDTKKQQLRDVAGLCETQLRDIDTAISAYKQICQIDRGDEQAREQLRRLLERGARWDDLATVLEQEAMGAPDVEQKIALEKKLATLHEQKRKDPAAAAEAWGRIASLSPEDDTAIQTAVKLFEKAERFDLAAQAISDNISGIQDKTSRGALLTRLGELRLKINDAQGAGDAFTEAASALGQAKIWEQAEKAYMAAGNFAEAARALDERGQLADGKGQAVLYAQAADLFLKAGDTQSAIVKLEQSTELDPTNDTYAQALEEQYRRAGREPDLVTYLLGRADKLTDKGRRVAARRSAATVQRALGDKEGARDSLMRLLADGDDAETLQLLVEDAGERGDHQEQVELLRRLGAITKNTNDKVSLAMREADILADDLGDVEGAIERYEAVWKSLDPKNRTALRRIADLSEKRDNASGAADALEREIQLAEGDERVEIAQRLAQLYEGTLKNTRGAIKALEVVHAADPEDLDAIARLARLSEEVEDWGRVAGLLTLLIETEGDEEEASRMTRRQAEILSDRLGKGDEALASLERLADQGDVPCREAYVELGDRLGWKGIVATKMVAWNESSAGSTRNEALRGAFRRFIEVGRESDAARVAMELSRSKGADLDLARQLEDIAIRLKNLDALSVAHDLIARELTGAQRASELVRQAETQVAAGVDPIEAIQHGESGLASVPANEVEPLLGRLAALTPAPGHVIDLYERQVGRCRVPAERLNALARAAQVAAECGALDRARAFFEIALGGGVQEDTIAMLEDAARRGDEAKGGTTLRSIVAEALAAGGQGSRDGGRTRAALLRRAANLAYRDLHNVDRAFGWLGDALIAHVDEASLDELASLGAAIGDMKRAEATIGRAMEEVFDGPLVRKLLQRRASLRRDVIGDLQGAAADLNKLHDLSPADQDVMNDLSALLLRLGDHRGMIKLYEDQILRGREPAQRAELARKVARLWEEEIGDAREAADAWRRVLRMKAGDPEATSGLDRAKTGKLKRTERPARPAGAPAAAQAPAMQSPAPAAVAKPAAATPAPEPAPIAPPMPAAPPPLPDATPEAPPVEMSSQDTSDGGYRGEAQPLPTFPDASPPFQTGGYAAAAHATEPAHEAAQPAWGEAPKANAEAPQDQAAPEAQPAATDPYAQDPAAAYAAYQAYYAQQAAQQASQQGQPQAYAQGGYAYPQGYTYPEGYDAQTYAAHQAAYAAQQAAYAAHQAAYPGYDANAHPQAYPQGAAPQAPPAPDAAETAEEVVEDAELIDDDTGPQAGPPTGG